MVVLVVLVVANIAVFGYLGLRGQPATESGAGEVAAATGAAAAPTTAEAPADPATTVEVPAQPAVLAVYGDGYAAGNEQGGLGEAGWPALVAQRTGATLALHATTQVGYATPGPTGEDLLQVVTANPEPGATVTVLFGSRNDRYAAAAAVQANVAQAIAAVQSSAPATTVVVVGPVWDDAAPPPGVLDARDAVAAAAGASAVAFVDPLADGWFGSGQGLIAADGVSPTDAGHQYLAGMIEPVVQSALEPAAASD